MTRDTATMSATGYGWRHRASSPTSGVKCCARALLRSCTDFAAQIFPLSNRTRRWLLAAALSEVELLMQTSLSTLGDLHDGSTKWMLLAWGYRRCRWLAQQLHPASRHGCHSNNSHAHRVLGQRDLHAPRALARRPPAHGMSVGRRDCGVSAGLR